MKLIEKIASNIEEYTRTERKIAEYIINNVLEFTLSTIGSVADELEISKTSLNRFAKSLGFDGYTDFRKKLQEEEVMTATPAERFKKLADQKYMSNAELLGKKEIDNISQCLLNINAETLEKLVEDIADAKHVYAVGFDVASFVAEILCCRMKTFGYPFEFLDGQRAAFHRRMMFAEENDILIVFDFPDYSDYCESAIEYAKQKGLTVVIITDYVTCPLTKYADMMYYCDSQTDIFKNSLIAPMFFINLLMSSVAYRNDNRMLEFLEKQEEVKAFEKQNK